MDHAPDILELVSSLKAKGERFALATVVRTVSATAAKAGAKAVILPDGTISEGWIGGGCARAAVLKAAEEALADGQVAPRLHPAGRPPAGARRRRRRGARGHAVRQEHLPEPGNHGHLRRAGAAAPGDRASAARARWRWRSPILAAARLRRDRLRAGRRAGAFAEVERRIEGYALPAADEGERFIVVSTQSRGDEAALQAALSVERRLRRLRRQPAEGGDAEDALAARGVDGRVSPPCAPPPGSISAPSPRRRSRFRSWPRSSPSAEDAARGARRHDVERLVCGDLRLADRRPGRA